MHYIDTGAFITRHLKRAHYYNRIKRVFSFDKHFELAGFKIIPQTK